MNAGWTRIAMRRARGVPRVRLRRSLLLALPQPRKFLQPFFCFGDELSQYSLYASVQGKPHNRSQPHDAVPEPPLFVLDFFACHRTRRAIRPFALPRRANVVEPNRFPDRAL